MIIDQSIQKIVKKLNELGLTTLFSCSGIVEEHNDVSIDERGLVMQHEKDFLYPYILFESFSLQDWYPLLILFIEAGFSVKKIQEKLMMEIDLLDRKELTDDDIRKKWKFIEQKIGGEKKDENECYNRNVTGFVLETSND